MFPSISSPAHPIHAPGPLVEFVGEIDNRDKNGLLGHAAPFEWSEPFGLVVIEASRDVEDWTVLTK